MGRREFLRLLCGSTASALLSPLYQFRFTPIPISVPPTLMLHSKDRWKLTNVLQWLAGNGYTGINYRQFASVLRGETVLPDKPVILSLDDVDTQYIERYFLTMIDTMEAAGYRGVLGVITSRTPIQNVVSWRTLNNLAVRGWEMDTHTISHALLPPLKRAALHAEIVDSAKMIADALSVPPTALIVPYANIKLPKGKIDDRIFQLSTEASLEFVVGMAGGRHVQADTMPPFYVGRIAIGANAVQTAHWIAAFNREPTDAEG